MRQQMRLSFSRAFILAESRFSFSLRRFCEPRVHIAGLRRRDRARIFGPSDSLNIGWAKGNTGIRLSLGEKLWNGYFTAKENESYTALDGYETASFCGGRFKSSGK